jgi:hypothetical protein
MSFFCSLYLSISCLIKKIASIVDLPDIKSNCFSVTLVTPFKRCSIVLSHSFIVWKGRLVLHFHSAYSARHTILQEEFYCLHQRGFYCKKHIEMLHCIGTFSPEIRLQHFCVHDFPILQMLIFYVATECRSIGWRFSIDCLGGVRTYIIIQVKHFTRKEKYLVSVANSHIRPCTHIVRFQV